MSAGKRLSQCSVFNDTQKFFYKVLELPSHYPFGWNFLSTYTHLILYPHCIIYSFITHIHGTFSHSMKNMVLYYLALLQIGLLKDLSKLITLSEIKLAYSSRRKKITHACTNTFPHIFPNFWTYVLILS